MALVFPYFAKNLVAISKAPADRAAKLIAEGIRSGVLHSARDANPERTGAFRRCGDSRTRELRQSMRSDA